MTVTETPKPRQDLWCSRPVRQGKLAIYIPQLTELHLLVALIKTVDCFPTQLTLPCSVKVSASNTRLPFRGFIERSSKVERHVPHSMAEELAGSSRGTSFAMVVLQRPLTVLM